MQCPNKDGTLTKTHVDGIEVDTCNACGGMWFEHHELDQLEDKTFEDDDAKNTLVTNPRKSARTCPVCSEPLTEFDYRWEELVVDTCKKGHGFWLDKDEEEKVDKLLREYVGDLNKKHQAEKEWKNHVSLLNSNPFLAFINKLLNTTVISGEIKL